STFMHSFIALGIITVQWVLIGYSLCFAPSTLGGFVGGFDYALLSGIGVDSVRDGMTIPHLVFLSFQLMFAIITPALISGAMAERVKFSAYCVFILLWTTLVYDPICFWVWNSQGWLFERGALDFAGGTVVHLSSGVAALVAALVLGRRKRVSPPHNLTMTLLDAGLLWFGCFGFNAGSAAAANGLTGLALLNTQNAAGAAVISSLVFETSKHGKPTALGAASG